MSIPDALKLKMSVSISTAYSINFEADILPDWMVLLNQLRDCLFRRPVPSDSDRIVWQNDLV